MASIFTRSVAESLVILCESLRPMLSRSGRLPAPSELDEYTHQHGCNRHPGQPRPADPAYGSDDGTDHRIGPGVPLRYRFQAPVVADADILTILAADDHPGTERNPEVLIDEGWIERHRLDANSAAHGRWPTGLQLRFLPCPW